MQSSEERSVQEVVGIASSGTQMDSRTNSKVEEVETLFKCPIQVRPIRFFQKFYIDAKAEKGHTSLHCE